MKSSYSRTSGCVDAFGNSSILTFLNGAKLLMSLCIQRGTAVLVSDLTVLCCTRAKTQKCPYNVSRVPINRRNGGGDKGDRNRNTFPILAILFDLPRPLVRRSQFLLAPWKYFTQPNYTCTTQ